MGETLGELGSGSHQNRKDFTPNPLNAVVVLDDPFKRNNPNSDTLVILTNGSVQKPFKVYDGYDSRSEIENGLFREAKQAWFIERPARNNIDAFRSHVYLTILMMALTATFQDTRVPERRAARAKRATTIGGSAANAAGLLMTAAFTGCSVFCLHCTGKNVLCCEKTGLSSTKNFI